MNAARERAKVRWRFTEVIGKFGFARHPLASERSDEMTSLDAVAIAARNKTNYLNAKAAFNRNDIDACVAFYALDHQIMSRPTPKGRDQIKTFFLNSHQTWPGIQLIVEHTVAENNWVMGRSVIVATHSTSVYGVQATQKRIESTFWDLHRFNDDGLIVETWNLRDNLAIMEQLGMLPATK
jgi:predicted ester cyclase